MNEFVTFLLLALAGLVVGYIGRGIYRFAKEVYELFAKHLSPKPKPPPRTAPSTKTNNNANLPEPTFEAIAFMAREVRLHAGEIERMAVMLHYKHKDRD